MIYRVHHVTSYDYQTPVALSAHLAHLLPRALPFQRVLSARLSTDPAASWRRDGTDHFGNTVTWLFLDVAHPAFEVTAEAMVDVRFPDPPPPEATPAWETVAPPPGAAVRRPGRRRNSCSTARWRRPSRMPPPTPPRVFRPAARCWRRCWS